MSFCPPTPGECPSRVAIGTVTATIATCRAYRIGGDTDYRKQARKLRLTATGFDRQAVFADEENQPATARKARAEASRLRALADSMEREAGPRGLCVNR
jgi:hypothetical protein